MANTITITSGNSSKTLSISDAGLPLFAEAYNVPTHDLDGNPYTIDERRELLVEALAHYIKLPYQNKRDSLRAKEDISDVISET